MQVHPAVFPDLIGKGGVTIKVQTSFQFHFISFHFISFHFISFYFISFHFVSFHFISFHFISFLLKAFKSEMNVEVTIPQALN